MQVKVIKKRLIQLLENESSSDNWWDIGLEIFDYQYKNCEVFRKYLSLIGKTANTISRPDQISFMPLQLFKYHKVKSGKWNSRLAFKSSTSSGSIPSIHYVRDPDWYALVSRVGFERRFGSIQQWAVFSLLPTYLERGESSLVYMMQRLYEEGLYGGFYLTHKERLVTDIHKALDLGYRVILFGVSYALMDLDFLPFAKDPNFILMETGGMKGTREEICKPEFYQYIRDHLGINRIVAEYGMTELFSQAYSDDEGVFEVSTLMKVFSRSVYDPLTIQWHESTGALNIIDLANIDTCSFLATDDLAMVKDDQRFEWMGRLDYSDIRGCNLMYS